MANEIFTANAAADVHRFLAALPSTLTLLQAAPRLDRRTYHDSFDWGLHWAGLGLVQTGRSCRLEPVDGGRARAVARLTAVTPPRWPADIPPGRMHDILARELGVRSLIPLVTTATETRLFRVRDVRHRPVARLVVTTWRIQPDRGRDRIRRTVAVAMVGKHPVHLARIRRAALAAGLRPATQGTLAWALGAVGLVPRSYSGKIDVTLDAAMSGGEAARVICRRLLQTIRLNESGLKADLDTEFLHDFRVAVRRTRAALGELRGVFPPAVTTEFRRRFKDLGQLTGPLRDLDVYLLDEADIRARVPTALQAGLDSLFARLRAQRVQAHADLVTAIDSASYRRLLRRWSAVLDPPAGRRLAAAPDAATPVRDLARARIHRRWRKLVTRGRAIDDTSGAVELHRLRIHGKKLRYLLEFFASLFPGEDLAVLVKHLKRLQDNLGRHNDLVVQRRRLQEELAHAGVDSGDGLAAAAIEALLDALAAEQREVRRQFAATFAEFTTAPVDRELFREDCICL